MCCIGVRVHSFYILNPRTKSEQSGWDEVLYTISVQFTNKLPDWMPSKGPHVSVVYAPIMFMQIMLYVNRVALKTLTG